MFGIILPGRPCLTNITTLSANQFGFSFPVSPTFSHLVIFMLPGNTLPPDTAAGVFLQLPGDPQFQFLGALANEKQSAIFKVTLPGSNSSSNAILNGIGPDMDTMIDSSSGSNTPQLQGDVSVGISIEPVANIQAQLAQLDAKQAQQHQQEYIINSTSLTRSRRGAIGGSPPSTKLLAQRIIKNAFNFLASFGGSVDGQEVVPLKSFRDWWVKFERRVENDPGFLERDDGE